MIPVGGDEKDRAAGAASAGEYVFYYIYLLRHLSLISGRDFATSALYLLFYSTVSQRRDNRDLYSSSPIAFRRAMHPLPPLYSLPLSNMQVRPESNDNYFLLNLFVEKDFQISIISFNMRSWEFSSRYFLSDL